MHRFHVAAELMAGETVSLPEETAQQVIRVLRLRVGARIVLFCGDGTECEAVVEEIGRREVRVRLGQRRRREVELPLPLTFAAAALKGEKLDWLVQKLTELGAARIRLLQTERTIVSAGEERWSKRMERYRRIATEAAEQSGRLRVPELVEPEPLRSFLQREPDALRVLLDPEADAGLLSLLDPLPSALELLSGPEGGWSPEEVRLIRASGAQGAHLGPRVLRAETAPIAAAAAVGLVIGAGPRRSNPT